MVRRLPTGNVEVNCAGCGRPFVLRLSKYRQNMKAGNARMCCSYYCAHNKTEQ